MARFCASADTRGFSGGGRGPRQPRERRAVGPEDVCNRCGQAGHWARDCAEPDTRTDEEKAPRAPKPGDKCRNCNEEGHFARDCPQPKDTKCRTCGEDGHYSRDCPQKGGSGVTPKLQEAAEQDAAQPATMEDADADAGATA